MVCGLLSLLRAADIRIEPNVREGYATGEGCRECDSGDWSGFTHLQGATERPKDGATDLNPKRTLSFEL
jgi:hypothetical protein